MYKSLESKQEEIWTKTRVEQSLRKKDPNKN